jgi:hypothetical protein
MGKNIFRGPSWNPIWRTSCLDFDWSDQKTWVIEINYSLSLNSGFRDIGEKWKLLAAILKSKMAAVMVLQENCYQCFFSFLRDKRPSWIIKQNVPKSRIYSLFFKHSWWAIRGGASPKGPLTLRLGLYGIHVGKLENMNEMRAIWLVNLPPPDHSENVILNYKYQW